MSSSIVALRTFSEQVQHSKFLVQQYTLDKILLGAYSGEDVSL